MYKYKSKKRKQNKKIVNCKYIKGKKFKYKQEVNYKIKRQRKTGK